MNRIVFGCKELVSAPQTVQLYTNVISVAYWQNSLPWKLGGGNKL